MLRSNGTSLLENAKRFLKLLPLAMLAPVVHLTTGDAVSSKGLLRIASEKR